MNNRTFHILVTIALVILGFNFFSVLIRHYWLMFFIWILLPFVSLWLTTDNMRGSFSEKQHENIKVLLVGTAFMLSMVMLLKAGDVRQAFGKEFVEGYRVVRSHNCEPYQDDEGRTYPPPDECMVEDLSQVAWDGRVILYLVYTGCGIFVLLVIFYTAYPAKWILKKKVLEKKD